VSAPTRYATQLVQLVAIVALGSAAFCGACLLVWSIGCNISPDACIANAVPTPVSTARPCGCGTRGDRE
jgi:hypothetical protein